MVKAPVEYATVSRLWPESTVVCLASGPSLCAEDVDYCRQRARVIAVKDAIRLAPWADALYFCGSDAGRWWQTHDAMIRAFDGLTFTLDARASHLASVLKANPGAGLSMDPRELRTGKNSGYQAIGLAALLGAARIVLLGFDMMPDADGREYFFGAHAYTKAPSPYRDMAECFLSLVEPLRAAGIAVINATRRTALTCFETMSMREAIA